MPPRHFSRHGGGEDGLKLKVDFKRLKRHFWPFVRPFLPAILFGTVCLFITTGMSQCRPLITRFLIDDVLTPVVKNGWEKDGYLHALRLLGFVVLAILSISFLDTVLTWVRTLVMRWAGLKMVIRLRLHVYDHVQRLSLGYFESRRTGDTMSRVGGDVNSMERLVTGLGDHLLTELLSLIITVGILFWMNWKLALCALLPIPFMALHMRYFTKRIRPLYRKIRDLVGEVNSRLQDNLSGIRVIKSFHTEDFELNRFRDDSENLFKAEWTGVKIWALGFPLVRFIASLGSLSVTGFGAYLILQSNPEISLGDLFAFSAYVMHLYRPIGHLFRMFNDMLQCFAAGERVSEVLESEPAVKDLPEAEDLGVLEGAVRFEDVSFGYEEDKMILKGVNLEVSPGQTIALVGRSGSGKTTLVNLIPRFYDPAAGAIFVDGRDIRTVTHSSLRRQVAVVLQDPFLFSGTILANIRYARPDASEEEVRAAAKAANADEFIDKLEKGYETEIGERGVKLSGGQKQRISIARALLADRRILILDEATSMIDSHSEILIQRALEHLMRNRTSFVIAHRLSTIQNADLILVFDEGKVVESGTHAELMEQNGAYADMYRAQFHLDDDGEEDEDEKRTPASGNLPNIMSEL